MIKRIALGVLVAAALVAIALGTRNQLRDDGAGGAATPDPTPAWADAALDSEERHPVTDGDDGSSLPDAGGPAAAPAPDTASGTAAGGRAASGAAPGRGATAAPAAGGGAAAAPPAAGTGAADAAAILRQTSAAYERVQALRAEFVQSLENPLLGSRSTSRGTLFQRDPDRFLLRFEEPAGDVIVSDGRHFWVYYPSVDARQVIRAPASQAGAGGVDLKAQFVGDPVERFQATLEGREAVAGRDAHLLTLVPRTPAGYRRLRVWIDARDHLVRRFEIHEANEVVRRFELRNLELNPRLGDDLFRFTPPADARIIDQG
jgi:outer membrane lipoprotein-sorting protein